VTCPGCNGLLIFKDTVKEKDLPQLMMWRDYMMSQAYDKLTYWGPRDAGLYKEENGKRVFNDKKLENAMIYNNDPDTIMLYGLRNGFANSPNFNPRRNYDLGRGFSAVSSNVPYMNYEITDRNPGEAVLYFRSGLVNPLPSKLTMLPWIWIFPNSVPGVEKMWAARTTWEDALMKTLAAADEAQFESLYADFLKTATDLGLNEETQAAMQVDFYRQNEPFMDNLLR